MSDLAYFVLIGHTRNPKKETGPIWKGSENFGTGHTLDFVLKLSIEMSGKLKIHFFLTGKAAACRSKFFLTHILDTFLEETFSTANGLRKPNSAFLNSPLQFV